MHLKDLVTYPHAPVIKKSPMRLNQEKEDKINGGLCFFITQALKKRYDQIGMLEVDKNARGNKEKYAFKHIPASLVQFESLEKCSK